MAIQFYLDIEGSRNILPVNPGEIAITHTSNNNAIEVVKLGEVNQLGARTLADFSFTSEFPKNLKAGYVNPKCTKKKPLDWVKLIQSAKNKNQRVRVIGTDLGINILATIEEFEWKYIDSTGDIAYDLSFKEYREFGAKLVAKNKIKRPKPPTNKPIVPGCEVIVNGRLHRDSYGAGPGLTEKNARRKVNFIKKGRKYPYHVTLLNGGWRGWVTEGSVRRV